MSLRLRQCPVCPPGAPSSVVYEASFDPSRLGAYSFASRKAPERMHWRMLQCHLCFLLYASPAPEPGALGRAYEDAAYDSGREADAASKTYGRYLSRYVPKCSGVLDIGTGNGSFLSELLARGFMDVHGVEPSLAPIRAADPDVRPLIRQGIFRAGDFADQSLGLITCFQTLEHVPDVGSMVADMRRLLRPGGSVFFVAHNREAITNQILGTRSPIFDVEHMQLFCPTSVRIMLRRAGFEAVEVFPIVNRYPLSYWARMLGLRLDWGMPLPLPAGNIGVVARKPVL